jgi:hypothetical protein
MQNTSSKRCIHAATITPNVRGRPIEIRRRPFEAPLRSRDCRVACQLVRSPEKKLTTIIRINCYVADDGVKNVCCQVPNYFCSRGVIHPRGKDRDMRGKHVPQSSHANVIHVAVAAGALAAGAVAVAVSGAFDSSSPDQAQGPVATPVALGAYATPNTLLAAMNEAAVAGQPGATSTPTTPTGNTGAPGGTSFFSARAPSSAPRARPPASTPPPATRPTPARCSPPVPILSPVLIHSIRRSGFASDRGPGI